VLQCAQLVGNTYMSSVGNSTFFAIPNFRLVWRPPYLPYHFRCHCKENIRCTFKWNSPEFFVTVFIAENIIISWWRSNGHPNGLVRMVLIYTRKLCLNFLPYSRHGFGFCAFLFMYKNVWNLRILNPDCLFCFCWQLVALALTTMLKLRAVCCAGFYIYDYCNYNTLSYK